jgi:hypothetical protein
LVEYLISLGELEPVLLLDRRYLHDRVESLHALEVRPAQLAPLVRLKLQLPKAVLDLFLPLPQVLAH